MGNYAVREIEPWLYSICGPSSGCTMYLVVGDKRALLYDTGYGLAPLGPVIRQITDLEFDVVLGHGHHDHVNGACEFGEAWINERDKVLCMRHASRTARRRVLEREDIVLPEGLDVDDYVNGGAGNLRELDIGRIFDLSGLNVEVVAMEGHTAGSVGLLIKERGVMLVGDAATPLMYMCLDESTGIAEYIGMLERTMELEFDKFFWGHEDRAYDKAQFFGKFVNAAKNICVEGADVFNGANGVTGLLYRENGVAIIFREDKLV